MSESHAKLKSLFNSLENASIQEIDIHPLIVSGSGVVAANAMIILTENDDR